MALPQGGAKLQSCLPPACVQGRPWWPGAGGQIISTIYDCNHAKWFPNGFPGGPPGPFQLVVASWRSSQSDPPQGSYGLSSLDLTPFGITS